MGGRIRFIEPDVVYELSVRTVDRAFLFIPNHRTDNPLLADTSNSNALSPDADVIPYPSIINIIGASVGRALHNHPIQLHSIEANINHLHVTFSVTKKQMENLAPFMRNAFSLIAKGINRVWSREGHVFGGRARIHACVDDESAESKLIYGITNSAKDNLIEKTSRTPFFSTYKHQASGKPLKYWYLDYKAYWTAGGPRNKQHRLKDYIRWVDWQTTPLPSQRDKTESQRQTWVRKEVRTYEKGFAVERKKSGKTVLGEKRLRETDPKTRPENSKKSSPAPLCHASTKEAAKKYKVKWKEFKDAHVQASADYRRGVWERDFPFGSYRPPLSTIIFVRGSPV